MSWAPPALRPGLEAALVELLAHTRAQSVRLIDLVSGRALVVRAARPVAHDPAADLAMARLADAAFAVGAADGGCGDLVLVGPRATHVLAPGPYRSVVVLRLGPGSDVGAARRAVLSPRLAAALQAGDPAAPDRGLDIPFPRPPGGPARVSDTGPMRALHAVPAPRPPDPGRGGAVRTDRAARVARCSGGGPVDRAGSGYGPASAGSPDAAAGGGRSAAAPGTAVRPAPGRSGSTLIGGPDVRGETRFRGRSVHL